MTISLEKACAILNKCEAVIVDKNAVVYPLLEELEDSDVNEFMYLSWEDENNSYYLKFLEGDNNVIQVKESSLVFVGHEGDLIEIKPLFALSDHFISIIETA